MPIPASQAGMPIRSLKWKLLLRIIIAILVVEAVLLVVSIAYRRQQLIDAHQPNQQTVAYSALPAEDRAEIRTYLGQYAQRITGAIVVVIVGTAGALYFLLNPLIIRPIQRIVRANHAMAEGHRDEEIPEADMPADELGTIMRSRAKMIARLYQTQAALAQLNQHQESLIDERTQELQRALDQLQQSQAQLVQSEKLSALGLMSASLAHEVVQPLTSIQFLLSELQPLADDDDKKKLLAHIEEQVHALAQTVDNFRRFSRKPRPPAPMDLNDTVKRACSMIAKQTETAHITLTYQLNDTLPLVVGDDILIQQMVLNLLSNARDALADVPADRTKEIKVTTSEKDGQVLLQVEDNGCGMPPEVQNQIFDLFYTTKGPEKGTGLGLAILRDIAQQLNANVDCTSTEGRGTTFTIAFQTAPQPAERQAVTA